MNIKILKQEDWEIWKEFRLAALKSSPESFRASYEEESNQPDSYFQNKINENDVFCAWVDDSIASCVGFYNFPSEKIKHRGVIWGVYTHPDYRKKGLVSALIQAIILHAKSRVVQIHLCCVANNLGAVALYQKVGFKIYGTEPRTLKVGDVFFDEHLMWLDLTALNNLS